MTNNKLNLSNDEIDLIIKMCKQSIESSENNMNLCFPTTIAWKYHRNMKIKYSNLMKKFSQRLEQKS